MPHFQPIGAFISRDLRRRQITDPGFTLIELQVVISIIAILAAMLIPAIALVRDQARLTRCASAQRQIAIACQTNAGEQEAMLPDIELANSGYWTVTISTYLEQINQQMNGTAYASGNFLQSCPEFNRTLMTGSAFALNGQLQNGNGGANDQLVHNFWAKTVKTYWTPIALGIATKAGGRLYVSDSYINPTGSQTVYRNYVLPNYDNASLWQTGLRHRDKLVCVFLDGHGGTLRSGDLASAFTGDF
jgi:prepilin-type N-terminal cleavage/methylation domain-containing protein